MNLVGDKRVNRCWRCLICAAWLLLAGCGYRFTAGGALPGNARALYVPVFKNLTAEPEVEALFTGDLRAELARTGREGGAAADAVVEGTVTQVVIEKGIIASLKDGTTQLETYHLRATAKIKVMRGAEVLAQTEVSDYEEYLSSDQILQTEANRRLALRRLSASLMRQAYQNLVSL